MGIFTGKNKVLSRKDILRNEELQQEDLLNQNKSKIEDIDISQRQGLLINSGLSDAEKQYILSDSVISSAIQMYLADITSICNKKSIMISSVNRITDKDGELAKKEEKVRYVFNQIFNNQLIEAIVINLLNNGEIFLDTKYNKGLNQYFVSESPFTRCTQLCFADGKVACYVVSDGPDTTNQFYSYGYHINDTKNKIVKPNDMVRIFNPTLAHSKILIELDSENSDDKDLLSLSKGNYLYYSGSLSLLKQVYPDWLNSKILELAVYRDRVAKSRFIQLIALELGRTSRVTSDQIYDSVKEYFDKRSIIDLNMQTFKSVIGNEPFVDYKVYTTRNGVGQLTFDNSLNGADANVNALADLDYNQNKVFAGLGIPKQYLGQDDDGSALSNGSSLFFIDEKYQKRIIAYIKRIELGLKESIKNLIIQQEGKDFFFNWDFDLEFVIPENNEDTMRVKNAKVDYVNNILTLLTSIKESGTELNIDKISEIIGVELNELIIDESKENVQTEEK